MCWSGFAVRSLNTFFPVHLWSPLKLNSGFLLKYKLNQTFFKFRFSFTNGLTQRQTDLSRWWLIVLPKVKHVLKVFFAKSSLGGFYLQFYLQPWYI